MSTQPFIGTITEAQRIHQESLVYKAVAKAISYGLRVAAPGIIQSFDATKQTVVVKLAIREHVLLNNVTSDIEIYPLLDVPIVIPRAGGFALTMAPGAGDECLVVFGDNCMNQWWQNGGVQNQEKIRRHDLSDGFAILGPWSQPQVLANYSTDSAQLRSEDGTISLQVNNDGVLMQTNTVAFGVNGDDIVTNAEPVASSTPPTMAIPIVISGTTFYIKLSTTP